MAGTFALFVVRSKYFKFFLDPYPFYDPPYKYERHYGCTTEVITGIV